MVTVVTISNVDDTLLQSVAPMTIGARSARRLMCMVPLDGAGGRSEREFIVRKLRSVGFWAGAAAASLALLGFPAAAEEKPALTAVAPVTVTQILSTLETASGQPIVMPQKDAQIVVSTFEIAPGAKLPEHKHPYPRYGYVLDGTLRVTNTELNKTETYGFGSFIVEAVGQWHKAENVGPVPIKLLVIDVMEKGANNTVLKQ
ncbi:cupin domain-containing protein [Bradyrhizobium sp. HKCCYLS1011]|uniref:cupin domain-containing protein n=1 Tax=Bradyrhizobium sp. HKCCYLS1011 TaxID=3420733 RepID=UPI003EBAA0A0